MNWYKKAQLQRFASITFHPAGSEKIAQPMCVEDVGYDVQRFILRELKTPGVRAFFNDITGDGDSLWDALGTINFYETPESGLNPPIVHQIVEAYNHARQGVVKLQVKKRETSNLYKVPVIRVQVVENKTQNYTKVPEMNLANDGAFQLLRYLQDQGLPVNPEDPCGSISVDALKFILSDQKPPSPAPYAREQSPASVALLGYLGESPNIIDASRPIEERFPQYVSRLKEIIDFIDRNQLPDRRIVYA